MVAQYTLNSESRFSLIYEVSPTQFGDHTILADYNVLEAVGDRFFGSMNVAYLRCGCSEWSKIMNATVQ